MITLSKLALSFFVLAPVVLGDLGHRSSIHHHARLARAHKHRASESAATNTTTGHTKRAPALRFPFGSTKVRGVNLGGWLVLEVSAETIKQVINR